MEIEFLGTGAGVPAKHRNVTGIALRLLDERNAIWLFDCGEGTQMQILRTNIRPRKIEKIFITHLHGDHLFGLPGLLSSRSFQGGTEPMEIYGPKGVKDFVMTALRVSQTRLAYPLNFIEVAPGVIFQDKQFTVICDKLDHGIASFGYRVVEADHDGELQVDKLLALGIKTGGGRNLRRRPGNRWQRLCGGKPPGPDCDHFRRYSLHGSFHPARTGRRRVGSRKYL